MTDMSNEISSPLTVDLLSLWHIIGLVSIENVPEFGKGNTCTVGTWTYVCELGESPTYPTFDMAEKAHTRDGIRYLKTSMRWGHAGIPKKTSHAHVMEFPCSCCGPVSESL